MEEFVAWARNLNQEHGVRRTRQAAPPPNCATTGDILHKTNKHQSHSTAFIGFKNRKSLASASPSKTLKFVKILT